MEKQAFLSWILQKRKFCPYFYLPRKKKKKYISMLSVESELQRLHYVYNMRWVCAVTQFVCVCWFCSHSTIGYITRAWGVTTNAHKKYYRDTLKTISDTAKIRKRRRAVSAGSWASSRGPTGVRLQSVSDTKSWSSSCDSLGSNCIIERWARRIRRKRHYPKKTDISEQGVSDNNEENTQRNRKIKEEGGWSET